MSEGNIQVIRMMKSELILNSEETSSVATDGIITGSHVDKHAKHNAECGPAWGLKASQVALPCSGLID